MGCAESNMQLPLQHTFGLNSTLAEIAAGKFQGPHGSKIRTFTMPHSSPPEPVYVIPQPLPSDSDPAEWMVPSNLTADFSALCWNFAVSLMNKTNSDVPLGLISSNVGGTTIQAWSERQKLLSTCKNVSDPEGSTVYYGGLYNGMIAPLVNTSVAGFLWYQVSSTMCVQG